MLSDNGYESIGEDNWQYYRATGLHTWFLKKKIFTININY